MTTTLADERATQGRSGIDRRLLVLIPLTIVLLDQVLKLLITAWLGPDASSHRWELAGDFLAFAYVENRGAAFGILPEQTGLLTAISILISGFGLTLMWREAREHPVTALAIGLVVGGALGNIVDRIRLGYVVDFVAVGEWPRFNLADSMVTIGVILLLWSSLNDERTASRRRLQEEEHV